VTFKFRIFPFTMLFTLCCLAFFAFLVGDVMRREGFYASIVLAILTLPIMVALNITMFMGGMNLIVDENGISRFLMGKRMQFLQWSNIKIIKDAVLPSPGSQTQRFFTILPIKKDPVGLFPGGKIIFSFTMDDRIAFVDQMNKYVQSNHIEIERVRSGKSVICNEILVRE